MKLKWIFAALVLANLGLWMWAIWYRDFPGEADRIAREPVAPEKMRLLNEPGVKPSLRKTSASASPADTNPGTAACFHIGPFPEPESVARAEQRLNDMRATYSRLSEEHRTISGYLVYLPPHASPKAAESKRQELTRLGFKDHAVMPDDEMPNAISLGLFSVEANAESRVRELAAKNIDARIKPMDQTRTRYWLNVALNASSEAVENFRKIEWDVNSVRVLDRDCATDLSPEAVKPTDTQPISTP